MEIEVRFLTTKEYAERRGLAQAYVRQLAGQGRLPGAVKRGRDWFIPVDAEPVSLRPDPAWPEEKRAYYRERQRLSRVRRRA